MNSTYQYLYDRGKYIIKRDMTTAFYNEKEQLHLERDVLDVDHRASLLQARNGMQFPRNEAPNNAALWSKAFCKQKPDQC